MTRPYTSFTARAARTSRRALALSALVLSPLVFPIHGQSTRVDLTGPFVHLGAIAGSVTEESAAPNDNRTGYGWGIGGGVNVTRRSAVVGSYTIFNYRERGAPGRAPMEQAELGLQFRLGGVETPAVFYVAGGGAWRHSRLTTAAAFPDNPPSGAGETVGVNGWAGWFGPGIQFYVGRRLAGELSVAWAWGDMSTARVDATTVDIPTPISLTTLRMRAGLAVTVF